MGLVFITLFVCAALVTVLVIRYDLYEREPWWMVLLAIALGAAFMTQMGPVEERILDLIDPDARSHRDMAIVAGTAEELCKFFLVWLIAVMLPGQFNDPMDGVIYGSLVGLGMAVEESIYFLMLDPPDSGILPGAEIVRLFGHMVMGGIGGFALGMWRAKLPGAVTALITCVAAAMVLHILWDWIAFSARSVGVMETWQTVGAVAIMLSGLLIYGMLVATASRWSRAQFAPDSPKRLVGWPLNKLGK